MGDYSTQADKFCPLLEMMEKMKTPIVTISGVAQHFQKWVGPIYDRWARGGGYFLVNFYWIFVRFGRTIFFCEKNVGRPGPHGAINVPWTCMIDKQYILVRASIFWCRLKKWSIFSFFLVHCGWHRSWHSGWVNTTVVDCGTPWSWAAHALSFH